jgi:hypothetical protein
VVPIFLKGLGKAMPKGDPLLVPFLCGAAIGLPLFWQGHKSAFLGDLMTRMQALSQGMEGWGPAIGVAFDATYDSSPARINPSAARIFGRSDQSFGRSDQSFGRRTGEACWK